MPFDGLAIFGDVVLVPFPSTEIPIGFHRCEANQPCSEALFKRARVRPSVESRKDSSCARVDKGIKNNTGNHRRGIRQYIGEWSLQ